MEASTENMILRLLALLLFALPAFAQDMKADPQVTTVALSAQADREVANDQVVVVVAAEEAGLDPAALSAAVNRKMSAAMPLVRAASGVKSRSAGYATYPVYKAGRIESWRVSQQLRLEGSDFAAMAQLVGQLQKDLVVQGLSVGLSPEARRAAEDALVTEAVAAFQARADIARRAMKATASRVRAMDIGTSGGGIRPMLAMARQRADSAPPSIEGGTTTVAVTVSGTVELR
jgi:predicted secreted protein